MASSNDRQRQLAREKYERQQARRAHQSKKQDRTRMIAIILIVTLVLLMTGGFVIGRIMSAISGEGGTGHVVVAASAHSR